MWKRNKSIYGKKDRGITGISDWEVRMNLDTIELLKQARNGEKNARDKLVNDNSGLVWSIVKRFIGRGCEIEDLFQIGNIGLMKAIDKFDFSYDVKFSTYAVPMITGEIKRFLRDDGMIKVSRSLKEAAVKIKMVREAWNNQNGKEPTIEEISAVTELTVDEIVMALDASNDVESIYKTVYQGDGNEISLIDRLAEKKDDTEKLLNHMLIEQLLDSLEEKERKLIELRYFEEKTQVEVAKKLGVSQVQVSRLEKKILKRMRGRIC